MKKTFTSIVLILSLCVTQMFYGTEVKAATLSKSIALNKVDKVKSDKRIFEFIFKNAAKTKPGGKAIKRKRLFSVVKRISRLTSPRAKAKLDKYVKLVLNSNLSESDKEIINSTANFIKGKQVQRLSNSSEEVLLFTVSQVALQNVLNSNNLSLDNLMEVYQSILSMIQDVNDQNDLQISTDFLSPSLVDEFESVNLSEVLSNTSFELQNEYDRILSLENFNDFAQMDDLINSFIDQFQNQFNQSGLDYSTIPSLETGDISNGSSLADYGYLVGKTESKIFKTVYRFVYGQLNNLISETVKAVNDYIDVTIGGIISTVLAGMGLSGVVVSILVGLATTYLVGLVKGFVRDSIKSVINYVLRDLFGGAIGNVVDGVIGFVGTCLEVILAIFGLLGDPESDDEDEDEGENPGTTSDDSLGGHFGFGNEDHSFADSIISGSNEAKYQAIYDMGGTVFFPW